MPLKNKNRIRDAIKFLLENQNLSLNYGRNARENVVEKFATKIINNKILEIYKISLSKNK